DQPFREGDTIRVDGIEGTVEKVGLRSTRIRTADRTVVSMPNGRLSEMRIESLAPRDRIRLACNLALRCDTRAEQVRKIMAQIEDALRAHSKIWPHTMTVCLKELGEYSLNIEIAAWFCCDVEEFTTIRQDMLLRFMEIVETAGSSLAFPTRTVHVVTEGAATKLV
ncbi:MAG TPA: mechanosensitive ion channel domain-containing protein, partial [Polyangiaceae bacterium]|nr:mechanosensitive ion channel domain-containing protein [Polyangiaceae bacterium]